MPQALSQEKRSAWANRIRLQQESGLSIERWCREHQIPVHNFHYWRDKLFPRTTLRKDSFSEITDVHESGLSLEYQGLCLQIRRHFDPLTLKQFLTVLRSI